MWFQSEGWRPQEITAEEFMQNNGRECETCRGSESKCWTKNCYFRTCAREKGLEYCFQCDDLPCEKLAKFANDGASHHKQTIENLIEIRKIGLKSFIESQSEPSFCPKIK